MAELIESGFRATSVTIDYDSRRLEAVRDELADGWSYLLKQDPKPQEPRGYKFIFRDPFAEPYALVKQDATEVNHPAARSEQSVAEICGAVLARDHLRPHEVVIAQGTPLFVYQANEDLNLPQVLNEARSMLTAQIANEVDTDIRRNRLSYRFNLGGQVYIFSLTTDSGPPAKVECSLRGHYDELKTEGAVEDALNSQGELLDRLTPKVQEAVSHS